MGGQHLAQLAMAQALRVAPQIEIQQQRSRRDLEPLRVHVVLDVGDAPVAELIGCLHQFDQTFQ